MLGSVQHVTSAIPTWSNTDDEAPSTLIHQSCPSKTDRWAAVAEDRIGAGTLRTVHQRCEPGTRSFHVALGPLTRARRAPLESSVSGSERAPGAVTARSRGSPTSVQVAPPSVERRSRYGKPIDPSTRTSVEAETAASSPSAHGSTSVGHPGSLQDVPPSVDRSKPCSAWTPPAQFEGENGPSVTQGPLDGHPSGAGRQVPDAGSNCSTRGGGAVSSPVAGEKSASTRSPR